MTVDVPDPRVPILVKRLGKKKAEKSGVIMMPETANEKLEENDALDIPNVLVAAEQWTPLDAKVDARTFSGIQIDIDGQLIISEQEHLATLSGTAGKASGNKPVLQSEEFPVHH
jgi:co-chaperonin GroES (HSP10)